MNCFLLISVFSFNISTWICKSRDFPKPDLGPFQLKYKQKLPKMVYVVPTFLVIHFDGNFMKIRTKIAKLQIHENLHKNMNENMFSFTFLCQFS